MLDIFEVIFKNSTVVNLILKVVSCIDSSYDLFFIGGFKELKKSNALVAREATRKTAWLSSLRHLSQFSILRMIGPHRR